MNATAIESSRQSSEKPQGGEITTSGGSVQRKAGLRGAAYADGEAALRPAQLKADGGRPVAPYDQAPAQFDGETPTVEGGGGGGSEGPVTQQTTLPATSLSEFFGGVAGLGTQLAAGLSRGAGAAVDGVAKAALPKDGTAFLEAKAKLKLPLVAIEAKFNLDIKDKGGKLETKGKMDFGTAISGFSKYIAAFLPDIKVAFGGAYEVKAVGDNFNECMRLMQVGLEIAMANAAKEKEATEEQMKAMVEAEKDKGLVGRMRGFFGYVWQGVKQGVGKVLGAPANAANWSLKKVIDNIWRGDAGVALEDRIASAGAEMDEGDSVEVKREEKQEVGAEYKIGDEEVASAKVGAGVSRVAETKTTVDKDHLAGKTSKDVKTVFQAAGEISLAKLGVKGKLVYKNTRSAAKGKREGELSLETSIGMGLEQAALAALGVKIWSHLSKWIEQSEKEDPEGGKVEGAKESAVATGIAAGYASLFAGLGNAASGQKPSKDAEATATWKWKHGEKPLHYDSVELKTAAKIASGKAKVLGQGIEGDVKGGYKQTFSA
jgi:hypothetical protein